MEAKRDLYEEMGKRWPSALVARHEVGRFTGGLLAPGTMANLDSAGQGPAERVLLGTRRVAYPVRALVDWLRGRSTVVEGGGRR